MIKLCVNCKSDDTQFIDNYKFHVEEDKKYLGNMKIFYCNDCKISFASPAPDINKLEYYYNNIYRAKNRPHSYSNVSQIIRDTHFSIFNLISQNINIENINNIYEVGPGFGQLGELFKLSGVNKIYSEEIDKNLLNVLKENYINGINNDIDLVLSIHSLEHFSNLDDFFNLFEKNLNSESHLLIEVPNNEFKKWFENREYDSPHLLFFSKSGLENILRKRNYKIIFSGYTGIKLHEHYKNMTNSHNIYCKWPQIKKNFIIKNYFKLIIKNILPNFIIHLLRKILHKDKIYRRDFLIDNIIYGNSDRSNIRILAKKE